MELLKYFLFLYSAMMINTQNTTISVVTPTPAVSTSTFNPVINNGSQLNNTNYMPADQSYFFVYGIVCTTQDCSPPNYCYNSTTCVCGNGMADNNNLTYTNKATYQGAYCNYQQKNQLTAFLLEFFVASGSGHFYSGRILNGCLKLVGTLVPFILTCVICCIKCTASDKGTGILALISGILGCLLVVWILVDVIMFGLNKFKDGNGVPLAHW